MLLSFHHKVFNMLTSIIISVFGVEVVLRSIHASHPCMHFVTLQHLDTSSTSPTPHPSLPFLALTLSLFIVVPLKLSNLPYRSAIPALNVMVMVMVMVMIMGSYMPDVFFSRCCQHQRESRRKSRWSDNI